MTYNSLPSLNAIRAFECTARHLNYKLAAQELGVTPAAVKQLVVKLEDYVGAKLLMRQGQGLSLTPIGTRSLPYFTEAFAQLAAGMGVIQTNETQNQLLLSVETSFASTWLVPKLEQFRVLHPHISVLIDSSQKITRLEDGHVDIAIRYGVDSPNQYEKHFLFDDTIIPACSPSLFTQLNHSNPKPTLIEFIKSFPLIHWDMSAHPWAEKSRDLFSWHKWIQNQNLAEMPSAGLSFNDYGQAVQAAIAGQGVLLASQPLLREYFESDLLRPIGMEALKSKAKFELVTLTQNKNRVEIAAFISWITKIVSEGN